MAGVEPDIRVFQNPDALGHAATALFVEAAHQSITERDRFLVCLSGGKTPERLYGLLAQSPYRDLVDWRQVHVFWGDERCVPAEDLSSSYRQARELLLGPISMAPENVHRVRTELEPEAAAEDYALLLRRYADVPLQWPRFDLVLLGLGHDGHTASIFPGPPLETAAATQAVLSRDQDRPGWRVTLTALVINSARSVAFLVQGTSKSRIVADVLYGEFHPEHLPAQCIRPEDGRLIWMLDAEAAGKP